MARDGNGTFTLPESPFVFDSVISETEVNSNFSDIATALTGSIAADGQTMISANLPMNSKKFTGLGAGSAAGDSANLGQVQAGAFRRAGTAGGTKNALTITPSPAITDYATGQRFTAIIGGTSSDAAATIAVSGLATKAIEIDNAALSASVVLVSGKTYDFEYDGTAFQATRLSVSDTGFANPMTTQGDIIRGGASGAAERLAAGTLNQVLIHDTTDAFWGQVATVGIADNAVDETKLKDALIGDFTEVAVAAGDSFLLGDVGDSGNTKRDTIQGILDLIQTGSAVLLNSASASASSSIDFTGMDSTYDEYRVKIVNLVSASDNVQLFARIAESGPTWKSGAADYRWSYNLNLDDASNVPLGDVSDSEIKMAINIGNAAGESLSGEIVINKPSETSI